MANRHNQHIYSKAFSLLAFRVLKTLLPEEKVNLSDVELKAFRSDATLMRFCSEERMDYIMNLLARAGKSWTFSIEDGQYDKEMLEFLTKDQVEYPHKRIDITERAAEKGVCVISSRDVMMHSHMLAQNCATKIYEISDFSKDLQRSVRIDKQLGVWEADVSKSIDAHTKFNDILLGQLNYLSRAEETMDLDVDDIRVLSALFKKRNTVLRLMDISTLTQSSGRKMYFRKNIEKLLQKELISTDAKDERKMWANSTYFMITAKGIGKIMEYQKFVYKNTLENGKR